MKQTEQHIAEYSRVQTKERYYSFLLGNKTFIFITSNSFPSKRHTTSEQTFHSVPPLTTLQSTTV